MSETQPQKEIIYVFIDSQNLNLSIRDQGWKLDFAKFRRYLADKFKVQKAFFFIGFIKEYKPLYEHLRGIGYHVIFKPTLRLPDKKAKGNVDAELVLHSMIEYDNYSKAIIISGDGDFYCLVKYLQQKNKLLKLIIPDKNKFSSLLREFRTYMVYMNDLKQKLELKKRE
ncbi:MAG: NYN domain-containing protein [Candidatus Gracilibacteria bacterium]|jgi:uncharacterized LabA/DUF88 family protein